MTANIDSAFTYSDLQGLNSLKQTARNDDPAAMMAVAQQFESMFMNMVLTSMREANDVLASDIGKSFETDFYRDMHDKQLALTLSQQGGFGLADVLYSQLTRGQGDRGDDLESIDVKPLSEFSRPTLQSIADQYLAAPESNDVTNQSTDLSPLQPEDLSFESPEDFIEKLMPYAQQASATIGVSANILLAQAALETGWGKAQIETEQGGSSFNFFGIKAGHDWQGGNAKTLTHEYVDGRSISVRAAFRAYDSAEASFNDYADFITGNERYQQAVDVASNDEAYVQALQDAGYATDPNYAEKILRIARSDWFGRA